MTKIPNHKIIYFINNNIYWNVKAHKDKMDSKLSYTLISFRSRFLFFLLNFLFNKKWFKQNFLMQRKKKWITILHASQIRTLPKGCHLQVLGDSQNNLILPSNYNTQRNLCWYWEKIHDFRSLSNKSREVVINQFMRWFFFNYSKVVFQI